MESALDPLDLVLHSTRLLDQQKKQKKQKEQEQTINTEGLAKCLEEIAQEAADLINRDPKQEFLYKHPKIGKQKKYEHKVSERKPPCRMSDEKESSSSSVSFVTPSSSTSEESVTKQEPWSFIKDFDFPTTVHEINDFIHTWELSPATKFVLIALNKVANREPYGNIYFVEAHFSKPTPKCPNPLAVAKVYFRVNVSHLLPTFYPINITYRFEGYKSRYYVMGEHKMSSNNFQRYFIDSIIHMKLTFYAESCECDNPLKPLEKRKKSSKMERLTSM